MNEMITIDVIIKTENIFRINVEKWFQSMSLFAPTRMMCRKLTKGKFQKINLKKFYENLDLELDNKDSYSIMIKDCQNSISLIKGSINADISSFSCSLQYDIFEKNKSYILSVINEIMFKFEGIVAYACSLEDWFWQENEDIQMYALKGKSTEGIITRKSDTFPDDDIVDIEYNPGHSHRPDGIWFGSCWMMWYGKEYFKYIPKEILSNFKNCYENTLYSNDVIRIALYKSPWDYDDKENREKQWSFRKSVGVDEVATMLKNKDKPQTDIDAAISISEGVFEHGGIRLFEYYYDSEGELTVKSQAVEVQIYELGEKGEILWSEVRKFTQ